MTNHVCTICGRNLDTQAMGCDHCRTLADTMLVEIGVLHAELPDQLERGQGGGPKVSGSREAPLPLRVDPLDLSMPAPDGQRRWMPLAVADQVGHQSVLAILDSWVRDWRDTRANSEHLPIPAGASLVSWLRNRLPWAYKEHPAVDEFHAEIKQLRSDLRRVAGVSEIRPELLDVPCRKCEWLSLANLPGQDRVECGHCGDLSTMEEYQRWTGLLAHGIQDGVVSIDLNVLLDTQEAALLAKVKPELIRLWVFRGNLTPSERTRRGRPLYRAGDVLEAERATRTGVVDNRVDQMKR